MEETIITPTSEVTETQVESTNVEVVETAVAETEVNTDEALQAELTKLQESGPKRTEEEKARYTIEKIHERFPNLKDGVATIVEDDEDRPVTKSEMRRMIQQVQTSSVEKSALELAASIPNAIDREMVKHHIEHTIRPSGDAKTDLAIAQSLVNAKRNELALAEQARRGVSKPGPSSSSAPAREEPNTQLTADEASFLKLGVLTKDEIIKARSANAYGTKTLK
jgi:hypothetical protein